MITVTIDGQVLDVFGNYAYNISGLSILDLEARNYEYAKGLKFFKSPKNKKIFGFADHIPSSRATVRAEYVSYLNIDGIINLEGKLRITSDSGDYYEGTFIAGNSDLITALEGYTFEDAVDLNVFNTLYPDASWNALTANEQYEEYMNNFLTHGFGFFATKGNTWPYYNATYLNIQPMSADKGQGLFYSIGHAFKNVIEDLGWDTTTETQQRLNVYSEHGEFVKFYDNYATGFFYSVEDLFAPLFKWGVDITSTSISKPYKTTADKILYKDYTGADESSTIENADIDIYSSLNMWELLVMLSKIMCWQIAVEDNAIKIIPLNKLVNKTPNDSRYNPVDLTKQFISEDSKSYKLSGYEQNNYIKFNTKGDALESFGSVNLNQNIPFLEKKNDLFTSGFTLNWTRATEDSGSVNVDQNLLNCSYEDNDPEKPFLVWCPAASAAVDTVYIQYAWEDNQGDTYNSVAPFSHRPTGTPLVCLAEKYNASDNFSTVSEILDDPLEIQATFKLSAYEVSRLQKAKVVKVDQLAGYYYVEPFEWTPNQNTKLTLIKLP